MSFSLTQPNSFGAFILKKKFDIGKFIIGETMLLSRIRKSKPDSDMVDQQVYYMVWRFTGLADHTVVTS